MKNNCWVIILAIVLFSCQKDTSDIVTSTAEVDVYVAGFVPDDANPSSLWEKPAYWKNGSLVQIDSDYYSYGYVRARALSISVSGNDVYVAGYAESNYPRYSRTYRFWKNGIQADVFTRSGFPPWAYELSSLVVSNSDVYMVGWFAGSAATYYKNESPIDIPDGYTATSIAVSGNDVYVCGGGVNGTNNVAVYWKNGNRVNLTDGSKDAYTTSIAVSGNDVYVAGSESNGTKYVVKYWKNGKPVNLTDGSTWAEVNSIAVSGSDVYVAGLENGVAKYWKNGSPVNLTDGLKWAEAKSIAVSANDVYVAGFEENIAGTQVYVAKYWKNGVPVILGDASQYSEAWSIFLAPK